MNILIIGGTQFVGRHIAAAFAAAGHRVALFNRGSNPDVHANLEQIHGDRKSDLSRLDGRSWDAVVDVCGYTPDVVEISAQYFKDRAKRYVYVSTISVYDHEKTDGPAEDAPLLELPDGVDETVLNLEYYGALKALCEQRVQRHFGERLTILRPSLVAGPYDPTDRFTYWPVRFDEGGDVLTPLLESRVQYIDARDLAAFALRVVEDDRDGIFNCVTPRGLTFARLCEACMHESSPEDASPVPASDEFLEQHEVQPWSDLPLWIPASSEHAGITNASSELAMQAGLTVRAIDETVREDRKSVV